MRTFIAEVAEGSMFATILDAETGVIVAERVPVKVAPLFAAAPTLVGQLGAVVTAHDGQTIQEVTTEVNRCESLYLELEESAS